MSDLVFWWLGQIHRDPRAMLCCHMIGRYGLRLLVGLLLFVMAAPYVAIASRAGLVSGVMFDHSYDGYQANLRMRKQLMTFYRQWRGVPYRYGGNDLRGVDCSGFVYRFYRDMLGMSVPRTTHLLARLPHRVAGKALGAGDILVFGHGHRLHVGIYIADGFFIHASKSKGVMQSSLSNPYWAARYNKAVRVML